MLVLAMLACSAPDEETKTTPRDSGRDDSGQVDSGRVDTGPVDTGAADTAKPDTAVADTAKPDTMVTDAGPTDTAVADTATATPDAGAADTAPDTSAVACTEAGAKLVAGHCYFALPASNGDAAKSACEAKGAHLVTITSGGEETLVEGFSPGSDKWIGLRATMTSSMASAFKWVTGEPVGYTNWGGGQPNSSGLCVWVRGSSNNWSDRACTDTGVPVCERE